MAHSEHIEELEARLQHEVATRERLEDSMVNEGRYQALLQVISDAMFIIDSEGVYLDYIPVEGFETLYPPEEFLGKSVYEIMPSDIAEASMQCIKEALRTNEQQRFDYDFSLGEERTHFETRMAPIGADSVLAVVREITVHKRAEETLHKSEERYRRLVETIPHGIEEIDASGIIIFANSAHHKQYGYGEGELIGMSILDLVATDAEREALRDYLTYLVKEQPPCGSYIGQKRTKGGRVIDVEVAWDYIRDEKGQVIGFTSVITDITAHKQAEEALRLQSEIVQNMAEGVYLIRVSDSSIVFANPTFEQMFGYDPGELIGHHVSIVNAPTDKDPAETANEIMASLLETGVWSGEVHNIRKDGTPFWCQANVTTVDHNRYGRVWVSVHTDITERKQAEEKLRTTQEYLDTILLNLPVGVAILEGPEFRYYRINHQLAEINGLSVEDHLDRPLAAVLPDAAPDIIPGLRHVGALLEVKQDGACLAAGDHFEQVLHGHLGHLFRGSDGKDGLIHVVQALEPFCVVTVLLLTLAEGLFGLLALGDVHHMGIASERDDSTSIKKAQRRKRKAK